MILNKTKNLIISTQEINATSFLNQTRGLMFRSKQNCLMSFKVPQKVSLHNLFVFFPLDILIINQNHKIVEIKQKFKPFTFWSSKEPATYCLELAIINSNISYEVGDEIEIHSSDHLHNPSKAI